MTRLLNLLADLYLRFSLLRFTWRLHQRLRRDGFHVPAAVVAPIVRGPILGAIRAQRSEIKTTATYDIAVRELESRGFVREPLPEGLLDHFLDRIVDPLVSSLTTWRIHRALRRQGVEVTRSRLAEIVAIDVRGALDRDYTCELTLDDVVGIVRRRLRLDGG